MTKNHKLPAPRYTRTTLALTGTHCKAPAHLSFEAALALQYATLWCTGAGSPKPPASGIIRRALSVYMGHLSTAETGPEVAAVRCACTATDTDEDRQRMALLRLYACPPGEPVPPFRDILRSPAEARQMADLTDRAEALAEACMRERPMRRRAAA